MTRCAARQVSVTVSKHGATVATGSGQPNVPFALEIPDPSHWSPESPFLYNLSVSYGSDTVGSYFGMREVSVGKDPQGNVRPCLSGSYRFLTGVLDQKCAISQLLFWFSFRDTKGLRSSSLSTVVTPSLVLSGWLLISV